MNNDEFDQMFNAHDNYNLTDEAFEYLVEIDSLKENLNDCIERKNMNERVILEQSQASRDYEFIIHKLTQQLKSKNQEINALRLKLKNSANNSSGKRNILTQQLENKVQLFLNECTANVDEYKRTGKYNNLEQSINKVRNFFNIFVEELIKLNSENRNVIGILDALMSLERCEQLLRTIRRQINSKGYPEIIISTSS